MNINREIVIALKKTSIIILLLIPILVWSSMAQAQIISSSQAYKIIIKSKPNYVIDIKGSSKSDRAQIVGYNYTGSENQKFHFQDIGNGYYVITAEHSGKVIDASAPKEGSVVHQFQYKDKSNQHWKLERKGNGYFAFKSAQTGMYLDYTKAGKFVQWKYHGGNNQLFKLVAVGKSKFTPAREFKARLVIKCEAENDGAGNTEQIFGNLYVKSKNTNKSAFKRGESNPVRIAEGTEFKTNYMLFPGYSRGLINFGGHLKEEDTGGDDDLKNRNTSISFREMRVGSKPSILYTNGGTKIRVSLEMTASLKPIKSIFPNAYNEDKMTGGAYTREDNPASWILKATKNWMSYIPDATKLKNLSIPGTHDAGALYGGVGAVAQNWTIEEQLDAGIRFLDIRCKNTGRSFAIHHGAFYQKQMFGDVMNTIKTFLSEHPTETIVIRLKEESSASSGANSFQSIWNTYATKYRSILFQSHNKDATLSQTRGKVYVMCNADCNTNANGMHWSKLDEKQDRYKVYFMNGDGYASDASANLPGKKKAILKYINLARKSNSGWVANHLSGAVGMTPPDVARATNKYAYNILQQTSGKNKLGIIIMDFPGESLIYRIIKSNFQLLGTQ